VRVLIVEDDAGVAAALSQAMRAKGWMVRQVSTGREVAAQLVDVDLVLLDMGLPDHDGLWVCQQVRASSAVPIVAVTARRHESAIVSALRAGVDDYVTKPYSLAILLARIDAVLRRVDGRTKVAAPADIGFNLDGNTREVVFPDGTSIVLTAKEAALLAALARNPDEPVTRAALMEEVWDTTWVGASRTLDVHVASLRAKLGPSVTIDTLRGTGYRLLTSARREGGEDT